MKSIHRTLAAAEVLLVLPATIFMTSLFVRNLQPQQYEPAHSAQRIVEWFASSTRIGLWLLLMALPFAVLVIGCTTLIRSWRRDGRLREATRQALAALRTHFATALIAAATVTAGSILAIVALHVLTD